MTSSCKQSHLVFTWSSPQVAETEREREREREREGGGGAGGGGWDRKPGRTSRLKLRHMIWLQAVLNYISDPLSDTRNWLEPPVPTDAPGIQHTKPDRISYMFIYHHWFEIPLRLSRPFSSKRLWFVDTVLWLCPSSSFWYIFLPLPLPPYPLPPLLPVPNKPYGLCGH